jgi:hypothetical protein
MTTKTENWKRLDPEKLKEKIPGITEFRKVIRKSVKVSQACLHRRVDF